MTRRRTDAIPETRRPGIDQAVRIRSDRRPVRDVGVGVVTAFEPNRVLGDEAPDPRIAEHLADCEPCVARYTELVALMDELRADADEATNAVFTPERLRAQQQHIERRIEHVGHAARVISFPRPAGGAGEEIVPQWARRALETLSRKPLARHLEGAA